MYRQGSEEVKLCYTLSLGVLTAKWDFSYLANNHAFRKFPCDVAVDISEVLDLQRQIMLLLCCPATSQNLVK